VGDKGHERMMLRVERPARYAGGELHAARPTGDEAARMAIVFPDTYEIGMSHVGVRILYHLVNDQPDMVCERAFHPWTDMEATLREHGEKLRTVESATPLRQMPLVGFSLPYEMLYGNVLNVLDLAGIPLEAAERGEDDPIVVAGGPCTYNPEPMAPYLDLAVVGEGEAVVVDLCRLANDRNRSRSERLAAMAELPGCYRPADLDVAYDDHGRVTKLRLRGRPDGAVIHKVWNRSLDDTYFPTRPLVPSTDIVHDRANLELHRGCIHGCRFCQAGYVYRPLRVRSRDKLLDMARCIVDSTGYEELGLVSLNSVDHPDILDLVTALDRDLNPRRVALGMPSLRMDAISFELARSLGNTKKTHITVAPEAGSQRLRDVVNKNLTEEQIFETVDAFLAAGWTDMKLYFMLGLPGETDEDAEAIVTLVRDILDRAGPRKGKGRGRPFKVTVNVSSFVAKSHTPFQWEAMPTVEELRDRMQILIGGLSRDRRISLKWRDFDQGVIEGLLARGDRRLAPVIRRVWQDGGVLESWSDRFDASRWERALAAEGLTLDEYVHRARPVDEPLPWDHICCGVSREFLARERSRALEGLTTPDCVSGPCAGCGFGADCPTKDLEGAT